MTTDRGTGDRSLSGRDRPKCPVQMTRNAAGVITSIDDSIVDLLGWQPEQLVGSPSTDLIHPADQPRAVAAWMEMITSPGSTRTWRGRYKSAQGSWKWVETENRSHDSDAATVSSSIKAVDPTESSLEEQLQAREHLLTQLSDALPVGILQVDLAGHITFTNHNFHLIVGMTPRESFAAQMSTVSDEDRAILDAALGRAFAGELVDAVAIRFRMPTNEPLTQTRYRVCLLSLRPLTDMADTVGGAVGCLSDVTERAHLHEELEIKAAVDQLTACMNRSATLSLLDRINNTEDETRGRAVVFIDLDGLKPVNDQFGHAAGDQLLATAADQIHGVMRVGDFVGRLGGDKFLVISPNVSSAAHALEIANRISESLTKSVDIGSNRVELRASIGLVWTMEAMDTDVLIAKADDAMYESKRQGKHGVTLYTERMVTASNVAGELQTV